MGCLRRVVKLHNYGSVHSYSTKPTTSQFSPQSYCMNLVRCNDHENFLSTLLINGAPQKRAAFAVRAFNVEVAKAAGSVSDDRIALMRLTFWSDAVRQLYSKNSERRLPEHPAIHEMDNVISEYKLPKMYLQRLVESRQRSPNAMFTTTEELEQHVEQSTSSVYYLLLRIAGVDDLNADHAASHLGKAQGISNLIRTLTSMSNQQTNNRMVMPPIPQEILLKYNCSYERILRQHVDDAEVRDCVFDVASVASIHLTKARNMTDKLSKTARNALLSAAAVDRFLERLRISNFHLYNERLTRRDGLLPLVYFWNNLRRRY